MREELGRGAAEAGLRKASQLLAAGLAVDTVQNKFRLRTGRLRGEESVAVAREVPCRAASSGVRSELRFSEIDQNSSLGPGTDAPVTSLKKLSDRDRRVNQAHVGVCLRKVSEKCPSRRFEVFREQADRICMLH